MYSFNKGEDVNQKMNVYIDGLFSKVASMEVPERNVHSHELIESYFATMGEIPNPKHLNRLAAFIDLNFTADCTRTKSNNEEYPVLSKRQIRRRKRREIEYKDSYKEKGTGTDPRN